MTTTPIIRIRQLSYNIGGKTIFDRVDLDIYPGEVFAVLGLSGTGKTTLLRLITGLIRPLEGTITVLGEDVAPMRERELNVLRAHMGLVFQFGALFDSLSVRGNVGFRLYEHTNLNEAEIVAVVKEKLRLVGLPDTEALFPSDLSGGMQKRVGIARALVSDPQIMLYDEPTSGLDPVIAAAIDELIVNLRNELGVTSIVVSHDVPSVLRMADRMTLLYDGGVRLVGTTQEFRESTDPVVRQFMEGKTEGPIQVI